MKPRARRVTIAAAALGVGVVGVLVVAHWGTVRDHVQAWYFQLTSETETIRPDATWRERLKRIDSDVDVIDADVNDCLSMLSTLSGLCVVTEPAPEPIIITTSIITTSSEADPGTSELTEATASGARHALESKGWRVIEQRFPRRAYVVIRDPGAPP